MEQFRLNLISAIKSIDCVYFQRHERDFSYELYHQLRILKLNIDVTSETPKSSYRIPEKLLSTPFFKNYFFKTENYDLMRNNYNRTPDLLLHEYATRNRQLFALEIKPLTQSVKLIFADLAKLLYYTESNLKFKKGILILFSSQENQIKLLKLKHIYQEVLVNFPDIEIWIVYPNRVHIVWSDGKVAN